MELGYFNGDLEVEEAGSEMSEQDSLNLPEEWVYSCKEYVSGADS